MSRWLLSLLLCGLCLTPPVLASPTGPLSWPADDEAHEAPIEWWYWTGHLQDTEGRRFGFEWTAFCFAMGGGRMWMVHHAISDLERGTFSFTVEVSMEPPASAGQGFAFHIGQQAAVGGAGHDQLHGELPGYRLELALTAQKPPVLQHGDGYTDYPWGGYTYYYSRTRMAASGVLLRGEEPLWVEGSGWFDHQWGDLQRVSELGWDWFALQLDDGRELMLFYVRDPDGVAQLAGGTWVDPDGVGREIEADGIQLTITDHWDSPHSGAQYPMGWVLEVGGARFVLTPAFVDQEIHGRHQHYWEGVVEVSGSASGRGYVELVGY